MNKRSLRLRAEVLTELANDELEAVVGADATVNTLCYGACLTRPVISCYVRCVPPPQTLAC